VLKVLYSPRKTLREVIKNPKYIGALLVFILFIGVSIASEYVFLSKYYSEQIVPNGAKTTILDQWTENSAYWTSPNANITTSNDALNGSIYGNMSIAFSAQNSQQVSMQLTNIGTVNCSAPNSYDLLSFRTKWTNPQTQPENVTIRIFSLNSSSDYFINDLTGTFSNSTYNIWNNITIQLDSQAWTSNGNADWGSVTGLQLQFKWASDFNMSILIDGLFFHGPYQSFFETAGSSYLLEYGISAAFQFVIIWVLLTGLIYAFVKLSKGKITWRPAFIAVGFVLMTMFIEILIVTIAFSTLPTIRVPFAALGGVQGEGTAAINTISSEIGLINVINFVGQLIFWVWASGLSSIIVRATAEFSRSKSIVIAGVACSISVLLMLIGII
jgi:hypothetical protein